MMVVGNKSQRQEIGQTLQDQPLQCGNFEMKEVTTWKWLGQIISVKGLGDSVAQTIASREGKVRGACLEIAQVCNDWRARAVGGLDKALLLWEICVVPSLLHGCGTWVGITAAMEKRLNDLQLWFARLALQVGKALQGHPQGRPHLGDRSPQHEAEDLDREGDACVSHSITG